MTFRVAPAAALASIASLFCSGAALAAAPANWSLGVDRLFGFQRVTASSEVGGRTVRSSSSSFSLFSGVNGQLGYSTPRLALDYLFASGVSLGGAIAYQSIDFDDDDDGDWRGWLVAPRLGYFASPTSGFGIWPRGGLTHRDLDPGGGDHETATAISVEVPLVFLVGGRTLGLIAMPYVDWGVGGGTDDIDRTLTDLGLQFGLSVFL